MIVRRFRGGFWRRRWTLLGLGSLLALAVFFGVFPPLLAWRMNQHDETAPPLIAGAQTLHSGLLVVDLRAGTLLWSRDLLKPSSRGHVDLARLTDGNMALQVLAASSRLPWDGDAHDLADSHAGGADLMTPLVIAQAWPPRTWASRLQRALYQAEKLRRLVRRAGSGLMAVRTRSDIDRLLQARSQAQANGLAPPVGVMLSVDEALVPQDSVQKLDVLYDAGFRMAMPPSRAGMKAPTGDASADGLTPLGRRWLRRMEEKGMVVDVAHSTDETITAIVANAQRPVVASHAGLRGACDTPGNLTDDQARGIAATGGLIAIGFWASAICDLTVDGIVKAIRYAVSVVGVEHVAFGSNFDSGAATPVDAGELARLTHGLTAAGFSDDDIARLAGANALRVLRAVLPP